jgi:Sulfotransferase family
MHPDFLGIGAQKAGTTWLARNLQTHPQIYMPRKEVHYFDRKIKDRSTALTRLRGKRDVDKQWRGQVRNWLVRYGIQRPSLRKLVWAFKYYMRPYNDEWYLSVFDQKDGKVAGEITPAYSVLDKERVAHVYRVVPDAKIIFFMRSPIERVWSHAVMSFDKVQKGSASSASEEQLLEKLGRGSTLRLTNYLRTFENWGSFYPEEQIFVGFLEDIHFFPEDLLRRLYGFLGVDPHFHKSLTNRKVHSRSGATMPTDIAVHLARNFHEEMARLSERFGGYASFWLYCAERLIEDPPEDEVITYPLYESKMWEEWRSGAGDPSAASAARIQSGPLASLQVAR